MSLQELQQEVARLSPEDRAKLREHLDVLETFSDPELMEALTRGNREAEMGKVISREELVNRLKLAGKNLE